MAKFAPVCPPQLLKAFKDRGELGSYHLLLAHDIVAKPDLYREIFDTRRFRPVDFTIILDNSVIELGGSVKLDVIVEAASIVRPTCTVLPDALYDPHLTIAQCLKAVDKWTDAFLNAGLPPSFMFVPQGHPNIDRWFKSFISCAETFASFQQITWWGIPRNAEPYHPRLHLPNLLHAINRNRRIHLLGFSNNVCADVITSHNRLVAGIDSAVPIRAVSQKVPVVLSGSLDKMPPRGDWWETATYTPEMSDALRLARTWVY